MKIVKFFKRSVIFGLMPNVILEIVSCSAIVVQLITQADLNAFLLGVG